MIKLLLMPAIFGFGSGLALVIGGRMLAKRLRSQEDLRAR